jgi:hypothetical protein
MDADCRAVVRSEQRGEGMSDRGVTTLQKRIVSALRWMKKQREQNLDMVTDAGDSSLWCKDEADLIRDHMNAIRDLWKHTEAQAAEIARLRGELASIKGACDSTKGEHVIMSQGRYKFCIHCGETMTAAKIKAAEDFVRARAALNSEAKP